MLLIIIHPIINNIISIKYNPMNAGWGLYPTINTKTKTNTNDKIYPDAIIQGKDCTAVSKVPKPLAESENDESITDVKPESDKENQSNHDQNGN